MKENEVRLIADEFDNLRANTLSKDFAKWTWQVDGLAIAEFVAETIL